jgi:hypothetical protein
MIINTTYPSTLNPCLVQINWSEKTGFFVAKNFQDGVDMQKYIAGTIVAIFKCKPKLKP